MFDPGETRFELANTLYQVINAISDGRLDMCKKMITKRIGLDEVVEVGFKALIKDKDNQVKILVKGSGEM